MTDHVLMGGRLHLYQRENSRYWQCATFLDGRNYRMSTREESLSRAKDIAEDWYLELRGKLKRGELIHGKTFAYAAEQFIREYQIITEGQRSELYVELQEMRLRNHILPFFGHMVVGEITPGVVQKYRIHRREKAIAERGQPPARSTMHQEIVAIRQVLKTANRHGWLPLVPDLSEPFKASRKISHRAWFSPDEYKQLYTATRKRAKTPTRSRYAWESAQLHDYVLFMANTGLRPDEAARLQYRDVAIVLDDATGETILEIEVRGKRGVGYCKSMTGAVMPFRRLKNRNNPDATDAIFPKTHREMFNRILDEEGLKFDREGNRRTAYSLRHTYICLRLMEGADIYQIAKNCRTSVEMIEKYYASHIKTSIDAAAVNVRKQKPPKPAKPVPDKDS
ncbi:tyrosine-type recombinase/integrase [bacterium]|nr:tyrosine-type recombinase/integrase [bacterium]